MFYTIKQNFEKIADSNKASQMEKYMRGRFKFYGIQTLDRRLAEKEILRLAKQEKSIRWDELDQIWDDDHREMQYFVCDFLLKFKNKLTYEDLAHVKKYVTSKQWWDTIDSLMKVYGQVGLTDHRVDQLMLKWSQDPDFWLRRVAIEHQLLRKDKMKVALLEQILLNNLNDNEFFVNKAIGWALRDYSKTNPAWVKNFIEENQADLNPLSIKEGSKYL
ncbi:DNA alkylation repair protein [Lactobacillus kalixensis]|uniref:DNA alkylation repair enzyme n=1 Tax=Lactobacillus kalixensis DSM 16043 TaxID=1423763 RepID=A0A0R1UDM2_9LACO|nr:DNA alkylation repair protein [Lactobacillus kalixensis]KRL91521.1 hypothetical protein FC46_GL000070 [Lactobacillus kalixensis DSM 16043]